jgi:hypothetical protein
MPESLSERLSNMGALPCFRGRPANTKRARGRDALPDGIERPHAIRRGVSVKSRLR